MTTDPCRRRSREQTVVGAIGGPSENGPPDKVSTLKAIQVLRTEATLKPVGTSHYCRACKATPTDQPGRLRHRCTHTGTPPLASTTDSNDRHHAS